MLATRSSAFTFALSIALAMVLLAIPGCGKKETDSASSSGGDGSGSAGDSSGDASGDGGGATEIVTDMTPDSFNQMKQMWETQVAGIEAQTQTIVQAAAEQSDAQLIDLANKLKAKTADMRSKFNALTYPAGVRAIQEDLPKWMEEAGQLIVDASNRLQTVLREKAGMPPG